MLKRARRLTGLPLRLALPRAAGISQAARTKGPLTAIGQLTARSLRIAAVAASRKATIELSMEVSITK
jgi:hypothetical protein